MTITDTQTLNRILEFFSSTPCAKNSEIVIGGDRASSIYYLKTGAVEVSYTSQDTKILVALIGAGNFFGEIGFFDEISRVRDIRATEESEILTLNREDLRKIQEKDPVLFGDFMVFLAERICSKFRRILSERDPLASYAESLSTGRRRMGESKPLPDEFFKTPEGQRIKEAIDGFKSQMFELSFGVQKAVSPDIPEKLQTAGYDLLNRLHGWLRAEGPLVEESPNADIVWGYIFKEVFPYFMRSRYLERAYFKPKGYAGDCNMIEMIYANEPHGDGKIGKLIDQWSLDSASCHAVRGRRRLLSHHLKTMCDEKKEADGPIRIMSLACGPSRELCDFLSQCRHSEKVEVLCVDIDPEALEMSAKNISQVDHKADIRFMNENLIKWALGKADQEFGKKDIIYSAGLLDYLDDSLFIAFATRCHQHLKPGGHLIVGNFKSGPDRIFMDHIVDWKLILREEEDFKRLFAQTPFGEDIIVIEEDQGINLFSIATH
ncbi:cyclic nucleotide-binding domain-containing protein [Desulfospira joergensenii]|uniref:cyclic nucleotide-binding domain-containing protein n=1 Tax=Desulfospira joergensenii TaxID=53329 RepID=UPI0003B440CE|nr:cyclic nucleotide-binding domain-containing protein [Desulfospira joergensenii]